MRELQADYFAGWLLAKLNVPKADIAKGMRVIVAESQHAEYPTTSERERAMALGYDVSTSAGAGPLKLLVNGTRPIDSWLKKWCRIAKGSSHTSPLTETAIGDNMLELDELGQLRLQSNGAAYVIARAMPSKDKLFAYMLFDNQFNLWWVERDGTIKSANKEEIVGKVDLSVVKK